MTRTANPGPVDAVHSPHVTFSPLAYADVALTNDFWHRVQAVNRTISLAHGYAMLEQAGNFANLRRAGDQNDGSEDGEFIGFWFADSDVYKWLEALAWELGRAPDTALQEMADEVIGWVEAAQQPNGYLNSYFQIVKPVEMWTDLDHGHELYCAGHLIQAAIAFHRVLGDDRLMAVALRFVDHIEALFGAGQREETGGHPEIEMALVELYRVTRAARHLELAQLFIDRRGQQRMRGHAGYGPVYLQDHVPVRDANEVAGHAVRQLYLTTAMADLYMEQGEGALAAAMDRLWSDMTERKLYLTGGIGSRFDGEAFGGPYELPADTCYCETCAAIASLMWNWRLLLITGDSRYADLFERTLYNGVLCSPSLQGDSYLYVNPLHVRSGRYVRASDNVGADAGAAPLRPAWHSCACCPPNVMRLFSSLGHYMATSTEQGVQIHQFGTMQLNTVVHDEPIALNLATNYPWDGTLELSVRESPNQAWALSLRLPAWCDQFTLVINGDVVVAPHVEQGYVRLERTWQPGDSINFTLEMPPRLTVPDPRIDAVRGCVAIERGPLVYCLESHDQPQTVDLLDVQIDTGAVLHVGAASHWPEMVTLGLGGQQPQSLGDGALYQALSSVTPPGFDEVALTAIPYFAWGNRGMESMRVWIPAH